MRVGITGAGGLLGGTLAAGWREAGAAVTAWLHRDLDVTDERAVRSAARAARPDVIVHCAAWTDVDGAESRPDEAMRVNEGGTAAVAAAAAAAGCAMVYVSTDYVFDGSARAPIAPDAEPAPLGAYARSKAAGERAVRAAVPGALIVRTGWLYGPGGRNFVDTMRNAAASGRPAGVVNDQWGAPTSARLAADVIRALVAAGLHGTWHAAADGAATWFDVARAVFEDAGADPSLVTPIASATLGRPAPRPAYAVLDCRATARVLGAPLPPWREQLRTYVARGVMAESGVGRVAA